MSNRFSRFFVLGLISLGIAQVRAEGPKKEYLALGDSLAFGFNPFIALGDLPDYHGYPQFVAASSKLNLANASCVGETSSSFLDVTAPDLGCHGWRALGLGMFVAYTGLSQSQNSYAVAFLRAHPKTRLVTITIGGTILDYSRPRVQRPRT